jgi:hypothetical protein
MCIYVLLRVILLTDDIYFRKPITHKNDFHMVYNSDKIGRFCAINAQFLTTGSVH